MPADKAPTVYLTFDDGPHPTATPYVLHQLEQYQAKGSFFCVGNNVDKFPETYNQVLNAGHTTANHTYNHMNGWKTDTDTYLQNIDRARLCIHSNLFRPPYGRIRKTQVRRLHESGPDFKIIMWSVLSADFDRDITPEKCLDNVLRHIRPGSIILFHDSEKAWDRMQYALPRTLAFCRDKGWQMKAIPSSPRYQLI